MSRSFTVIARDGRDGMQDFVDAMNFEFKDRNIVGDSDAMDMSFDVCVSEAVQKLGGVWSAKGEEYYVALDGAPLSEIVKD